jgi:hypothetical protein
MIVCDDPAADFVMVRSVRAVRLVVSRKRGTVVEPGSGASECLRAVCDGLIVRANVDG